MKSRVGNFSPIRHIYFSGENFNIKEMGAPTIGISSPDCIIMIQSNLAKCNTVRFRTP
jgi:20S proteasome alpha/beta subunit